MIHEYLPADCRERIKDLLKEREMSQAQLAEKIGISESAFSRYLSGQTDKLSTENIVAIAKVFDVTTDFLLCLTDIPFTTNFDIEKLGLSVKAAEKLLQSGFSNADHIAARILDKGGIAVVRAW